jgi:hypothetical protein
MTKSGGVSEETWVTSITRVDHSPTSNGFNLSGLAVSEGSTDVVSTNLGTSGAILFQGLIVFTDEALGGGTHRATGIDVSAIFTGHSVLVFADWVADK